MKYTTEGCYGLASSDSMIDLMDKCRVFAAYKKDRGNIVFQESCDEHFCVELTKEQVLALAQELIDLADGDAA